jgi:transcription initiation factor TFIID subunit TAF12
LKQHTKTHQQQQEQHQQQQTAGEQWQQCARGEEAGQREHSAVTEPLEAPGTDMVSLTQVIPYLETIRVEYY